MVGHIARHRSANGSSANRPSSPSSQESAALAAFKTCGTTALVAGVLMFIGAARRADAQIEPARPNVFLVLDNSGSMRNAVDGSSTYTCAGGEKGRWLVVAEALTGSINDLECQRGGGLPYRAYRSNDCYPSPRNLTSATNGTLSGWTNTALSADAMAWPNNGTDPDKDAIEFVCGGGGDWDQSSDGLIDQYSKQVRFGTASFDAMRRLPGYCNWVFGVCVPFGAINFLAPPAISNSPAGARFGTSWPVEDATTAAFAVQPGCQLQTRGWTDLPNSCFLSSAYCFGANCVTGPGVNWPAPATIDADGSPGAMRTDYSYWFKSGASNWTVSPADNVTTLSAAHTNADYPGRYVDAHGDFGEYSFDIGIRNSAARPWEGRLIGFGAPEWDVTDSELKKICKSDDECTESHNFMVQQAVLGQWQYTQGSTPLAASLRDAYEFMTADTVTEGVYVPHKHNATLNAALKGKIGPQNDPAAVPGACRKNAVILLTDGEPSGDIQSYTMSHWAGLLFVAGIDTYVVAVGLTNTNWDPDGTVNGSGTTPVNCNSLLPADLTTGMCQRHTIAGPDFNKWQFADVTPGDATSAADQSGIRACCELLETANAGGTSTAFYPSTPLALKQKLGGIIGALAAGAVSRTVPVFAPVTPTFVANPTGNAQAAYYELRSSMQQNNSNIWRGHLERVRYTCNGANNPVAAGVLDTSGDIFEKNLDQTTAAVPRKIFTVAVEDKDAADGTVRSNQYAPNNYDGLFNSGGGSNTGNFKRFGGGSSNYDAAVPPTNFDSGVAAAVIASTYEPLWGSDDDVKDVIGLKGSDKKPLCRDRLGDTDLDICAERLLSWYGGTPDPDGGSDSVAPSRSMLPGNQCQDGVCSPFGAIYRSSPIVIPPPTAADSDDQNYGRVRTNGGPSFIASYGARPTMVYSQTIDGMLHAMVLSRNDYTGAFNSAPSVGDLTNNELWSFVPPAVMSDLKTGFDTHSRQLDGQMAWANIVYDRPTAVANVDWPYNTVIVGASGANTENEGFYYAMDVTDPFKPRFLWQMSTSGKSGGDSDEALFGDQVPGAAITNINFKDAITNQVKNIAVAILPGGTPTGAKPTGTTDRDDKPSEADGGYWEGTNRVPRSKIRDWSGDQVSRSLTFVELKTGRILARLTQKANAGENPEMDGRVIFGVPFDSPISGIPVAYPTGVGKTSDRVYVGDIDGTLWRIDLHDPNPATWSAEIAFDYNFASSSGTATLYDGYNPITDDIVGSFGLTLDEQAVAGQPIINAPLLSQDDQGQLVVTYATGDQEVFYQETKGMINMLVSFAEELDTSTPFGYPASLIRYQPKKLGQAKTGSTKYGVEMVFLDGGAVTGPINLFDSQLYFAHFIPNPSAGVCTAGGGGGICGVRFDEQDTTNSRPIEQSDLTKDGTVDDDDICQSFINGEVVFGVSISLVPSCNGTPDSFNDPWLGGDYAGRTSSTVGSYELVYHTGEGGASEDLNVQTKSSRLGLDTPKSKTRVRTWVSVTE